MQNSENCKGGVKEKADWRNNIYHEEATPSAEGAGITFPCVFLVFFLVGFFFFSMCGNVIVGNKAVHQSTSKIHEVMHQGAGVRRREGGGGGLK